MGNEDTHRSIENIFKTALGGLVPRIAVDYTYSRLCAIAGKPTLLGIAFRAATVVNNQLGEAEARPRQTRFSLKIAAFLDRYDREQQKTHDKPAQNAYHQAFRSYKTLQERRIFTRMSVDCLLLAHLESKGFDVQNVCRICGAHEETFAHIVSHIPRIHSLPWSSRRSIDKTRRAEDRQKPLSSTRIRLFPAIEVSALICDIFKKIHITNFVRYRLAGSPHKRAITAPNTGVPDPAHSTSPVPDARRRATPTDVAAELSGPLAKRPRTAARRV